MTSLTVGVLREVAPGERRVALVPDGVRRLVAAGCTVLVADDAGKRPGSPTTPTPEPELKPESRS